MTQFDPRTRRLTRDQLSTMLQQWAAAQSSDSSEERTSIFLRADSRSCRGEPAAEPLTEPTSGCHRGMSSSAGAGTPFWASGGPRGPSRRRLALGLTLALTALVAGGASRGLLSRFALTESKPPTAATTRSSQGEGNPARAAITQPSVGSHVPPAPSRSAAVEQLISGRTAEALDSYRALALAHADEPTFAFVVTQLEREVRDCRKDPKSCAR